METKPIAPPVANTVEVACQRLGICRASLYKAMKAGKIRTVKFGARRIVPETELQRLAEEGW